MVSGLWHGAAWTFVMWGAVEGLLICLERIHRIPQHLMKLPRLLGRPLATAFALAQVWTAFLLFMAQSVPQAVSIMDRMYLPTDWNWRPVEMLVRYEKQALLVFALIVVRELWHYVGLDGERGVALLRRPAVRVAALSTCIVLCVFFRGPGTAFVYFQF